MEKEGMMVVDIKNIVTRLPELRFTAPVNWRIDEGQQWAVIGGVFGGRCFVDAHPGAWSRPDGHHGHGACGLVHGR